jgi:hypothetical protein
MPDRGPDEAERAPQRPRFGKLAIGRIEALTLGGFDVAALRNALQPGTEREHNQRLWRMGAVSDLDGYITGAIGFQRTLRGGDWDEETKTFVRVEREDQLWSPFAIETATMRVAFQTHGNEIRPQSFLSAFQALLEKASPTERWRVHHETTTETFQEWLGRVERVERIHVRVERPNPNYHGRDRVEEVVEGLNAKTAELTARADPEDPQGLDTDGELLRQLVDHADARYGSYDAAGTATDGARMEWHSTRRAGELEVELDPDTGVAPPSALIRALEDDKGHEDDPADG